MKGIEEMFPLLKEHALEGIFDKADQKLQQVVFEILQSFPKEPSVQDIEEMKGEKLWPNFGCIACKLIVAAALAALGGTLTAGLATSVGPVIAAALGISARVAVAALGALVGAAIAEIPGRFCKAIRIC